MNILFTIGFVVFGTILCLLAYIKNEDLLVFTTKAMIRILVMVIGSIIVSELYKIGAPTEFMNSLFTVDK